MIPTRRLVALAAAPFAVAVVAVWIPGLAWPILGVDLLLALVAALDALLNRGAVVASREHTLVQSVGRPFEVTLLLDNVGHRTLSLHVHDDAPGSAEGLPAWVRLPVETRARIPYEVRVDQRGEHGFGAVTVRWSSPLGLWERQRRLTVDGAACFHDLDLIWVLDRRLAGVVVDRARGRRR